jgi:hypothetical protein
MTSRTTPVGIVVVALAGLVVIGCSAPTTAVFQALLEPAGTAMSSPEADTADGAVLDSETSTWWQHPSGYEMVLPAGWSGVAVDPDETDELVRAVDAANVGLGDRIDEVIGGTDVRVSAIAVSTTRMVDGKVAPGLLVLAEPTAGRKPRIIKSDVLARISSLPGLSGAVTHLDVLLPRAEGVRYDYTISDPTLGDIRVRSYYFKYGHTVYLVNLVASSDLADAAESDFNEIQDSLQFGA